MDTGSLSVPAVLQNYARQLSGERLVAILLLISMSLQLVLIVLGSHRYHCSGTIFRFIVWGSYISADAVAVYALGAMAHSCARSSIYGIWAAVLLLHLGGPDAVVAYSRSDCELWWRHGFNMVSQVSLSIYVIYLSGLKSYALASAVLLLVAGATKYAERTLALWFASESQIAKTCMPISIYMKKRNVVRDRGYVVMGEKQIQRIMEEKLETRPEPPSREERDNEAELDAALLKEKRIITVEDVKNSRIEGTDYNLCLSFAFFKMYMRRFVSMHFHEGDWKETRAFWFNFNGKEAFTIVQTELKFMYNVLFSKGSGVAFSSLGIALRFLNIVLTGVAAFLILRESKDRELQHIVTSVVISVAVAVEVFQLYRILVSDWTRVRLICAQIEEVTHPLSMVIRILVLVMGKIQNVFGGDGHRANVIYQYNFLAEESLKRSLFLAHLTKFMPYANSSFAPWLNRKVSIDDDLKEFIFNILKSKCSPEDVSETFRDQIYYFEEDLLKDESEIKAVMPSHENLEDVILVLHLATRLCNSEINNENARRSGVLSRYCAYLLVSRPQLLPVHPGMIWITYKQILEKKTANLERTLHYVSYFDETVTSRVIELQRALDRKPENEMWELLAAYWAGLVIYIAVYNKTTIHAECVASGGEFLSQLWVLVGHMGFGVESDSAIRKNIESSTT